MILTLKTDRSLAEAGLYRDGKRTSYREWSADRELSHDIHRVIEEILIEQKISWGDLSGIIFYAGPGSFTGLRIGASVSNTIAYELDIPIVKAGGERWIEQGIKQLADNPSSRTVVPDYGRPARVTKPRK